MFKLISNKLVSLSTKKYYSNFIGSGKKFLKGASDANKLLKPNLKYLAPLSHNYKKNNIDLKINHDLFKLSNNKYLLNLSLRSDIDCVKPTVFVCCLDISSSMDNPSTYNDSDPEFSKFSRWDLVKHSMNTIIHCLRPEDKLSIITFSSDASKQLSLLNMDERGKKEALIVLNNIKPYGMTNLWQGMDVSLHEFNKIIDDNESNLCCLVFTDGEPNVDPENILTKFISKYSKKNLVNTVHTFGYGYDLDSKLLNNISKHGTGTFSHIPDHTMCNTVFINFLSHCLSTSINNAKIQIKNKTGCTNIYNMSNNINNDLESSNEKTISVGQIQSGINRNITLGIDNIDNNKFSLELEVVYGNNNFVHIINNFDTSQTKEIYFYNSTGKIDDFPSIERLLASNVFSKRIPILWLCNIILNGLEKKNLNYTKEQLDKFCVTLLGLYNKSNNSEYKKFIDALYQNIKSGEKNFGQICKAFDNDEWFNRWGTHYLKYFVRSHQQEICSNFKDTSLQTYAGPLFLEIKKEIEDIFSSIPIPKPSRSNTPFFGNFQSSSYSPGGPCIDGNGTVKLVGGKTKLVKELLKGDKIINTDGNVATIRCVIMTKILDGFTPLLSLNGMKITPWHPINLGGFWMFPADVGNVMTMKCDYVYNFVLDKHHIMTVNGVDVITLGHGFDFDPVLIHPFFGTNAVIEHLKTHSGWDNGFILIEDYKPSYKDGLINGFW